MKSPIGEKLKMLLNIIMFDLSILIAARNEEFLNLTLKDIISNMRANTEVVVVIDNNELVEPVLNHPRIRVFYMPEVIGQRAAINLAARNAKGKYIMKLDAHCKLAEGFDRVLIDNYKPNQTVIPRMYNLHAFDWQCQKCGSRVYQGPYPDQCYLDESTPNLSCDNKTDFKKVIVWKEKPKPISDFFYFDKELRFKYWSAFNKRQESLGDISETMSNLGACWFMSKEMFFDMDCLDENHGSWGQMGTEISCKTWLSERQQVVNKKTWFSHMFRTRQGFSFPYAITDQEIDKARNYSIDYWLNNRWPKAKRNFNWIIEHFSPVPDWHE